MRSRLCTWRPLSQWLLGYTSPWSQNQGSQKRCCLETVWRSKWSLWRRKKSSKNPWSRKKLLPKRLDQTPQLRGKTCMEKLLPTTGSQKTWKVSPNQMWAPLWGNQPTPVRSGTPKSKGKTFVNAHILFPCSRMVLPLISTQYPGVYGLNPSLILPLSNGGGGGGSYFWNYLLPRQIYLWSFPSYDPQFEEIKWVCASHPF